ncbi:MAG TPA: YncE family protein [Candidatus Acidoferrum sp.]|nr:YncE family protein [Candidatus Acidoferrum sp.]
MKYRVALIMSGLAIATAAATWLSAQPARTPGPSKYTLVKTISIPGDEGWDYVGVDSAARRVYVSHGSHVVVLDADTYAIVGDIPDTAGVHGIAVAPELGRGFISSGRANSATFFDLKTLKAIGTYPTGTNPDAIAYEPVTKRVFTFNGRSQDVTALNATDGSAAGTFPIGGKPEFAVADGNGGMYVNIEDKSELVHFDAQKLTILHRWPLAPCEEPSGLAIDLKSHRLFVGCGNKMMAVVEGQSGKVITTLPIGDGVDANGFDPATNYAFASTGDGKLTVVHEDSPDKFTVVENVPTKKTARTMGLDLKTHAVFLPSAEFDPPAPGERRGKMKPGSFAVLVMKQQ